MNNTTRRRDFLRGASALAAATLVNSGHRSAAAQSTGAPRYFFAVGALGGASILDSFMPLLDTASAQAKNLTSFSTQNIEAVNGVGLQCIAPLTDELGGPPPYSANYAQRTFLQRHGTDTCVMTLDHSSVNHSVGQQRSLNGSGINSGRTLLEAVASHHGQALPIPAVNMMSGEFSRPGIDSGLPPYAEQLVISDARYFALGAHGSAGLPQPVDHAALQVARAARAKLENRSAFAKSFGHVGNLQRYLGLRSRAERFEASELAQKVALVELTGFGVPPELSRIREVLPDVERDPFQAQAALAFLLVKNGASCSVGISPSDALSLDEGAGVKNPALAFDASHNTHRIAQHVMWSRLLGVTDALITLLKETEDPRQSGSSLWDSSLLYMPTEFGRTRGRPAGLTRFGTGHYQNNGVVLVSPLLKGGRAFGGLDPTTGLTYGFDPRAGDPVAGKHMDIGDVYSVICQTLGVDFPGLKAIPTMIR